MIVRTPDGKWAVYSSALRILTRVGLDERDALSAASEELGSIDKARAALADVESWDAVLRLMDEPTRKALARRYGVEAPPPAPQVRRRELAAEGRARAAEARARRLEKQRERHKRLNEERRAALSAARATRVEEKAQKHAEARQRVGKVRAEVKAKQQKNPLLDPQTAVHAYEKHQSISAAARAVGTTPYKIKRALEVAGVEWDRERVRYGPIGGQQIPARRLELLAAAAEALTAHGVTLKELTATLRASEGEINHAIKWAADRARS